MLSQKPGSNNLHIETGRHTSTSRHRHICRGCITDDIDTIEGFLNLPECMLQLEDEIHVLFDCEYYSDVRNLSALEDLCLSMLSSPEEVFKDEVLVRNLSKLATVVFNKHWLLIHKDVKEKPTGNKSILIFLIYTYIYIILNSNINISISMID